MKPVAYKVTGKPVFLPVSLAEVKRHCRIDESVSIEDAYLFSLIRVATLQCEHFCEMQCCEATFEAYLDKFPGHDDDYTIEIVKWPVNSIEKIEYYDDSGEKQTLNSAYYDTFLEDKPAKIVKNSSYSWPATGKKLKSVIITFKAGFANVEDIPDDIRQGILMMILHLYENRQDVTAGVTFSETPLASRHLWYPYALKLLA